MIDNRNTILAVILSGLVLLGWQYFFNIPQMEKQRAVQLAQQSQMTKPAQDAGSPPASGTAPAPSANPLANAPASNQPASAAPVSREAAIAATPRVRIDTPRLSGSISLKGARIDDLSLVQFRETVDPNSPPIVLYSPSGSEIPTMRNSAGSAPAVPPPESPTRIRPGSRKAQAA